MADAEIRELSDRLTACGIDDGYVELKQSASIAEISKDRDKWLHKYEELVSKLSKILP